MLLSMEALGAPAVVRFVDPLALIGLLSFRNVSSRREVLVGLLQGHLVITSHLPQSLSHSDDEVPTTSN